jgi:hypothetical protein
MYADAGEHLHVGVVQNIGEDCYVERTIGEHSRLSGPSAQIEMGKPLFATRDLLGR